jgi:hypothetical protein
MLFRIKSAGAAAALILVAAGGAAGCEDSGGVAVSAARQAADHSGALAGQAEQAGISADQIPAATAKLSQTTMVQNINAALDGLGESRAREAFDAACAEALPDFFEASPDPQDQAQVDEVANQLPDPESDSQAGVQSWALCEEQRMLGG